MWTSEMEVMFQFFIQNISIHYVKIVYLGFGHFILYMLYFPKMFSKILKNK